MFPTYPQTLNTHNKHSRRLQQNSYEEYNHHRTTMTTSAIEANIRALRPPPSLSQPMMPHDRNQNALPHLSLLIGHLRERSQGVCGVNRSIPHRKHAIHPRHPQPPVDHNPPPLLFHTLHLPH